MIGTKIAGKITDVSKNLPQNNSEAVESETELPKERYRSQEKDIIVDL